MTRSLAPTLAATLVLFAATSAFANEHKGMPHDGKIDPKHEVYRGNADHEWKKHDSGKAAKCPPRFDASFEHDKLVCYKIVYRTSHIKCPSRYPYYKAREGHSGRERDICWAKAEHGHARGKFDDYKKDVHYVFVPWDGERDGVSYVADAPHAKSDDGWRLDTNRDGDQDRYYQKRKLYADPVLVPRW
jgi:hypothetical protein